MDVKKKPKMYGKYDVFSHSIEKSSFFRILLKVFTLLKFFERKQFQILCPQVLTVAGMAVLKIICIPLSLIGGRYHFMLLTISTGHLFFFFSFCLFLTPFPRKRIYYIGC